VAGPTLPEHRGREIGGSTPPAGSIEKEDKHSGQA